MNDELPELPIRIGHSSFIIHPSSFITSDGGILSVALSRSFISR